MPAITLAQAQAQLDAWLAASLAVSQGQAYEIAGRRLSRANAAEVLQMVTHWERQVDRLNVAAVGRGRARTIVVG